MSAAYASVWPSRLSALVLAAAAMGSAVAWGIRLRAPLEALPPATLPTAPLQVDAAMVARALGAPDAEAAPQAGAYLAASRMVLVGVLAKGLAGSALIAVDGKPPKPVAVGGRVGEDWVLVSVAPRRAVLRSAVDGNAEPFTLEMPLTATLLPKSSPDP
ncbi:MAG: general secretion pathway protein C [Rhodoferax sp.]|nr:MAG: general secretion pathway protein C [Rhodoferax sp.]